jgi:hypothetical protein
MLTSRFFVFFTEAGRPFWKMDIFKNVQNAILKNKPRKFGFFGK